MHLSFKTIQLSYADSQDEATCISFMIKHYRELFPVPRPMHNMSHMRYLFVWFIDFQVAKEEVQKDQVCITCACVCVMVCVSVCVRYV